MQTGFEILTSIIYWYPLLGLTIMKIPTYQTMYMFAFVMKKHESLLHNFLMPWRKSFWRNYRYFLIQIPHLKLWCKKKWLFWNLFLKISLLFPFYLLSHLLNDLVFLFLWVLCINYSLLFVILSGRCDGWWTEKCLHLLLSGAILENNEQSLFLIMCFDHAT